MAWRDNDDAESKLKFRRMFTLGQRAIVDRDRERVKHGRMNEKQPKLVGAKTMTREPGQE